MDMNTTPQQEALIKWAVALIEEDMRSILGKVTEYGATDLEAMGTTLVPGETTLGIEAACQFYLLGKVARASAGYREGHKPSDDTLKDQTIYSLMTRFARAFGYWGLPPVVSERAYTDEVRRIPVPPETQHARRVCGEPNPNSDFGTEACVLSPGSHAIHRSETGDVW